MARPVKPPLPPHEHDAEYAAISHAHDADYADISHAHDWEEITSKPATFAPDAHTHPVGDISATGTADGTTYLRGDGTWDTPDGGAVDSVNAQTGAVVLDADDIDDTTATHKYVTAADLTKLSNLSGVNTGDQDLSGYAPMSHDHDTDYAALSHDHAWGDITDKPATFAPSTHTQAASTITDFDTEVSNNTDVAANTTARHTHSNAAVLTATTASFTTALNTKLTGIATGAEVNVNADWNAASGDAQILNKPTLGTAAAQNVGAFATAAQGALADTAVQPAGLTKAAVGLGNVDNTSDADKPVSTATTTALAGKANTTHTHVATTDLTATGTKSSATYLRGDNTWNTPTNTTYTELTEAEITTGTASTLRTISGRRAQFIVTKAQTTVPTPTLDAHAANKLYVDTAISGVSGGDGAVSWGSILGTLANQTDLAIALDAKVDESAIATVATTGSYADLTNKPTIPADQVNSDWAAVSGVAQILNKPTLHTHGNQATLDAITAAYTTADATKLSGIAAGAEVNVQSDWNAASGDAFIANKPTLGTAAAMASTSFATAAQGTKADTAVQPAAIANFETTTQLNTRDTNNRARANHTGTQSADTLTDGTTNKAFLATERTKLSGIATGATANATDAQLRDRATHTGAQAISTVTGLQTTLDGKASTSHNHDADYAGIVHTHPWADITDKPAIPSTVTGSLNLEMHGTLESGNTVVARMPFAGTWTGWDIYSKQTGSIVLTVSKTTHASYPTMTEISGSQKPTITGYYKNSWPFLSGWTETTFSAGDVVQLSIDSVSGIEDVYVSLRYTRAI